MTDRDFQILTVTPKVSKKTVDTETNDSTWTTVILITARDYSNALPAARAQPKQLWTSRELES